MTRINLLDPPILCDQHLIAEWRELTRIPNSILSGKMSVDYIPESYTVRTEFNPSGGKGHMKFFANKLLFLRNRYLILIKECEKRNFNVHDHWNYFPGKTFHLWNDYNPTESDILLSSTRIIEKIPKHPRYYGNRYKQGEFKSFMIKRLKG